MTITRRLTVKKKILPGEKEELKGELKDFDAVKQKVFKLEKLLKMNIMGEQETPQNEMQEMQ